MDDWQPNYNIAPSTCCPVLYSSSGYKLELMRWGLTPSWAKDLKMAFSTGRSETAAEKPSFRHAFKKQRCLIPMNGWFEWKGPRTNRQPYNHFSVDEPILMTAGLHEYWTDKPTGEITQSFTILTQDSYNNIADIHHRMPVLISQDSYSDWLNPEQQNPDQINQLIADQPRFDIEIHPVDRSMNNARYQDPDCITPID